uniref:Protein CNGC15b-like n=1 Tax=Tanacetum cinerariifolium TaxID=118510 RepID=A0A6L2NGQ1_TANCI|nr:protein CNGC15b-like [Tanacetum cinerariifolium]
MVATQSLSSLGPIGIQIQTDSDGIGTKKAVKVGAKEFRCYWHIETKEITIDDGNKRIIIAQVGLLEVQVTCGAFLHSKRMNGTHENRFCVDYCFQDDVDLPKYQPVNGDNLFKVKYNIDGRQIHGIRKPESQIKLLRKCLHVIHICNKM